MPGHMLSVRPIDDDLWFRLLKSKAIMKANNWIEFIEKVVVAIEASDLENRGKLPSIGSRRDEAY